MSNGQLMIPQTNPKANYLAHKTEIDTAIAQTLDSGWYILGREVANFEQEFATYISVNHAVGVANGTDGLEVALRACGVGADDAVFTVSHTAVATVAAIELVGAQPVLVDVDPATYVMDPNQLEYVIQKTAQTSSSAGKRPRAIIPVHLYGHPVDMPAILEIAKRYDLYVIEDCSQAHGATIYEQKVGGWGDLAVFSLYPTKNLGALGDGGIIASNNRELMDKCRALREYGWQERYVSAMPGLNSRLDELQAAILRVKLRYLNEENQRRQALAQLYTGRLSETHLILPTTQPDVEHVYHQYVVRTPVRDELRTYLRQHGIGTLIHYPVPIHLQPAYHGRLPVVIGLPETEKAAKEVLSLPMYPELSKDQVEIVAQQIKIWNTNQ